MQDAKLGLSPSSAAGLASARASSLTHVVPSGIYPQGAISSFYPEFLRIRNTPARHDAVAEEVDKELLMSAQDAPGAGRGFAGLSVEIRDFLKNKDGPGTKDEKWTRLDEMAGFSLGGFGFFQTRLGWVPTIANGMPPSFASLRRTKILCGAAAC